MNKRLILQLLAAALGSIETAYELLGGNEDEETCSHPKELRADMSTMGRVRWKCECGFVYDSKPDPPPDPKPDGG